LKSNLDVSVAGAGLSGAKEAPEDSTCRPAETGVSLRSNSGHLRFL